MNSRQRAVVILQIFSYRIFYGGVLKPKVLFNMKFIFTRWHTFIFSTSTCRAKYIIIMVVLMCLCAMCFFWMLHAFAIAFIGFIMILRTGALAQLRTNILVSFHNDSYHKTPTVPSMCLWCWWCWVVGLDSIVCHIMDYAGDYMLW